MGSQLELTSEHEEHQPLLLQQKEQGPECT